jgi:hypothetical protein
MAKAESDHFVGFGHRVFGYGPSAIYTAQPPKNLVFSCAILNWLYLPDTQRAAINMGGVRCHTDPIASALAVDHQLRAIGFIA